MPPGVLTLPPLVLTWTSPLAQPNLARFHPLMLRFSVPQVPSASTFQNE